MKPLKIEHCLNRAGSAMAEATTRYYKFVLDSQNSFVVETTEPPVRGARPVAGGGQLVERAQGSFEEMIAKIPAIIAPIRDQIIKGIPETDTVQVELGFKISGEFEIIVAKTQAEANFKVSFVWKGAKANSA